MGGDPPPEGDDVARLTLPCGSAVAASRRALASRAAFFRPLEDEQGAAEWGAAEFAEVATALTPGARAALPDLLALLGAAAPAGPAAWDALFCKRGVVQAFAAAHFLGALGALEAAQEWAGDSARLAREVSRVPVPEEGAALRTALRYGLDARCPATLLHAAAEADAVEALRVILTEEDALGDVAVATDPTETCGVLSPVDLRDRAGRTALHVCAVGDCAGAAAALLDASASLEALCDPPEEDPEPADGGPAAPSGRRPPGLRTALHLAAAHDAADVVQLLLDRKAQVAACVRGARGAVTPLHECAAADAGRAARALAAAAARAAAAPEWWLAPPAGGQDGPGGADAGRGGGDEAAGAPAEGAAPDDEAEVQWSRFLDPLQAKVGDLGSTPLHAAAEEDAPAVVAALLEARADPSVADAQGDTPVHCAVLYAAPRALAALLAGGADAVAENDSGEIPLHYLAEFGPGAYHEGAPAAAIRRHFARSVRAQEALVDALRRRGQLAAALAHAGPADGATPLHAAARWDHLGAARAARLLVEARANADLRDASGLTPLDVAVRRFGAGGAVATALRESGAAAGAAAAAAPAAAPAAAHGAAHGAARAPEGAAGAAGEGAAAGAAAPEGCAGAGAGAAGGAAAQGEARDPSPV